MTALPNKELYETLVAQRQPLIDYSISELVMVYNMAQEEMGSSRTIGSFRDKPTAVRRVGEEMVSIRALRAEERTSPGRARLLQHPDAEKVRQEVLADQQQASEIAAGGRTTVPTPPPSDPPPVKKRHIRTGRHAQFGDTDTITVLVDHNPKRGASAERFSLYRTGMLVSEYKEKAGDKANRDLAWDIKQKFIRVS